MKATNDVDRPHLCGIKRALECLPEKNQPKHVCIRNNSVSSAFHVAIHIQLADS